LFGVLAAFALNRRRGFELFQRGLDSTPVITFLGLATAGWLCLHPMRHESFWDAQLLYVLMTLTVIGLAIRPAIAFVNNRFLNHMGKISYGIYLLHMFVIAAVKKMPGGESPALCFVISTGVVIIVASLVYKFFEQPIIAFYKRKLSPYDTTTRIPAAQEEIPAASVPPVEQSGRVPI
jgi:peptidoglycan/LPS O-acetylase OafA/YrhL